MLDDSTEKQNIKSSKDPMVRAFLLNRKFESLVETEYEFKSDYKRLSNQCEEFAVSLLQKCQSVEEISCIMSVPGVDQLEHVEVRGWKEAQKLSVLNFAIANKNEKVRAIYIASVSSGRLKDYLSVQIKWELFWVNKTNCGNKPIIDFSLVAGMRETDYRIYSNIKAPRRLFNISRHKCGGYSRAALI